MKIVKCLKCNKYIHKTDKCFYCGNTLEFYEVEMQTVHENVLDQYIKVESLIENKKFTDAFSLSHKVIEWMPNLAGIFWLRLLAKNKCTSAVELISKGFDCENDADLCNALNFSSGIEHDVYHDVHNIVGKLKNALQKEVLEYKHSCKMNTNLLKIKKDMQDEIDGRKQKLFSLWSNLTKTEQELYILEKDCQLVYKEYSDALNKAAQAASSIKSEMYKLEECTEEEFYKYQMKIGSIIQQSEQAKADIESMKKQHPWIMQFNDLVAKRDEQIQMIENEMVLLKKYEIEIQKILNEIDQIEEQHRKVICAVESYDFQVAARLLGQDSFNQVFRSVGIGIDVQIFVQAQESQSITIDSKAINGDIDMEDYYRAWGMLDEDY